MNHMETHHADPLPAMIPEQSADAMEIDAIKEPVTKKHAVGQVFNKHPPCGSCGKPWK